MTKTQMIEALRLKEGKAWERLKDHEYYCKARHGEESEHKDWTDTQKAIYDRYIIIWVAINETLKDLKIEAYTYTEREALKNQNLNSL